jgi:uncharacterized phage protein (TIGR02220 family)
MAKDLPYFKFFSSEWSDGDITLEDFETQGLFINICAYYWSNECDVDYIKLTKKFKDYTANIQSLIDSKIIKIMNEKVVINFLNEQFLEREYKSNLNSIAGKKSAESRRQKKQNSTEIERSLNLCSTEVQPLREEKKREDINNNLKVDWDRLLEQFNKITGKSSKVINNQVKVKILARLKEGYTKQDLIDAIRNCYEDPYHKETNHKYLTLEFISRADKMEKYSTIKQR